ncbi:hypothetical protein V8J38_11435 [Brevundimonas olei]|uniref:Uncharacterized protein n=1 Tax=Brevundimonas olei TaxID=657642 RepID=A0ABZ2I8A6_9CAUL
MTDPMELVGRLERNSKQTITRYCGDLDGAIVPHALLTEAAACIREMVEKREGLEEDLYQAVLVAYRRGAREWARLNYPALISRLEADEDARELADAKAKKLAADDGCFPWVNLTEAARNQYRAKAIIAKQAADPSRRLNPLPPAPGAEDE